MPDVLPLRRPELDPSADPAGPPLVADARRLAAMLCCSVRAVRTWDAAGRLPAPVRIGGRVVWRVDEIRRWLDTDCPDRETWAAIRGTRKT